MALLYPRPGGGAVGHIRMECENALTGMSVKQMQIRPAWSRPYELIAEARGGYFGFNPARPEARPASQARVRA